MLGLKRFKSVQGRITSRQVGVVCVGWGWGVQTE